MEAVDTVGLVAEENSDEAERRRCTIPIWGDEYEWWTDAVRRQLDVKGLDQKQLADRLGLDAGAVSRCINRKKPLYEILIAISDELAVAYPVILPISEEQAIHLAKEKRLFKREKEVRGIKAGAAEKGAQDQPLGVVSEHAVRSEEGKAKGRQGARRQHARTGR